MISGERRLTPVARVATPTPRTYVLAVAAAVVGTAIPLLLGSLPVLVVLFSAFVLLLSFVSAARPDPYQRMVVYPLVICLSLVLLINLGPITWTITALAGCAMLGATLGRARRAARQEPEILAGPPTDPMGVPGTTVATWTFGKDVFEALDPEGEKIDGLVAQLNDNSSVLTLRRGSARMDAVGFAPGAVEIHETDDVESAHWHTLLPSRQTILGGHAMANGPLHETEGESLRRAQVAARHFALSGSRSREFAWSASHRAG